MRRIVVLPLVLAVLLFSFSLSQTFAQAICVADSAKVDALLATAKAAADKGDNAAATDALAQARQLIQKTENQCNGANKGNTANAVCSFVFDATVRNGTSKGTNVRGLLTLVESKPGEFSGLLIPGLMPSTKLDADSVKKLAGAPVVVAGSLANNQINLAFNLADGAMIKGSGAYPSSTLADCNGSLEGTLTGPKSDDVGDWLGGESGGGRAACISRGVSGCIAQFGANGSTACSVEAAARCVALYTQ